MLVSEIAVVPAGDCCELRAKVSFDTRWVWGDQPFDLFLRFPSQFGLFLRAENGDPFVAAFLPMAMVLGESLRIAVPVSAKLLKSIPDIQSIYHCWNAKLAKVVVDAPVRSTSPGVTRPSGRRGVFYSMGVDSSYTLLKNAEEHPDDDDTLTHLIVVEGYDVYPWESYRFPPMLERIRRVATHFGKGVLPVTTNLRDVSDRIADWVLVYHGPALATVALALGCMFDRIRISAGQTYSRLIPRGSHPCLDPLWGTESLFFTHDGLEATRIGKILRIARVPVLAENLRVCATDDVTPSYNCGKCMKCLETMIGLHVAGVLGRSQTFPHEIDVAAVRDLTLSNAVTLAHLKELLPYLGADGRDAPIREALGACIARNERALLQ